MKDFWYSNIHQTVNVEILEYLSNHRQMYMSAMFHANNHGSSWNCSDANCLSKINDPNRIKFLCLSMWYQLLYWIHTKAWKITENTFVHAQNNKLCHLAIFTQIKNLLSMFKMKT